ncbi:hypothetical protein THAOC_08887, partial [Thalassiosira oceanica]
MVQPPGAGVGGGGERAPAAAEDLAKGEEAESDLGGRQEDHCRNPLGQGSREGRPRDEFECGGYDDGAGYEKG